MAKASPRQAKETATPPPLNKRTELEAQRDHMKAINAHYRKHKTLDGIGPEIPAAMVAKVAGHLRVWARLGYNTDKPFPPYELARIGARIREAAARTGTVERDAETPMQRLADLTRRIVGVPKSEMSAKPKPARKRRHS